MQTLLRELYLQSLKKQFSISLKGSSDFAIGDRTTLSTNRLKTGILETTSWGCPCFITRVLFLTFSVREKSSHIKTPPTISFTLNESCPQGSTVVVVPA
uniref:hypothetical protein n=1 Tax=Succinivibrio sp. TaxID=2053619 RepID=UPI00402A6755